MSNMKQGQVQSTILLIEDDPDIRDSLGLLLEAEGLNVVSAEDCSGGFEILLRQQPSLVIIDVMLPDYSGLQFIRWMRERTIYFGLPVIAMSAFEPGYLTAAASLGADAVLRKPEGLDHLSETIADLLKNTVELPREEPQG